MNCDGLSRICCLSHVSTCLCPISLLLDNMFLKLIRNLFHVVLSIELIDIGLIKYESLMRDVCVLSKRVWFA